MPIAITSQFDSGAIEVASLADPGDIQLRIRTDNASEFAQWFHFALHGAAGTPVRLRFLNAGQCAYPKGWEGYRIAVSTDRQHWQRVDTTYDGTEMVASLTPETHCVWFAYFEPYSHERHLDLIGSAASSELVTLQHLGNTLEGRDMTLLHIRAPEDAAAPLKKIWLIARQHPGETMAEWFAEGFLERLLDADDPVSRRLLEACEFFVVPHMNPDGAVRGNLRTNGAGANLNREWLAPSAERSPEVLLVRQKMLETGVDLFLDAHGDEGLPYNFVVGTDGIAGFSPRIAALQENFKAAWLAASPDFQVAQGYPLARPSTGNTALATNWVGQQFDCLAFTIEMPFKDNADLPDPLTGWSGERSKKLGASVLQAVLALATQLR
jgi:murein tripeptide amidase MpaA